MMIDFEEPLSAKLVLKPVAARIEARSQNHYLRGAPLESAQQVLIDKTRAYQHEVGGAGHLHVLPPLLIVALQRRGDGMLANKRPFGRPEKALGEMVGIPHTRIGLSRSKRSAGRDHDRRARRAA